MVKRGKRGVRSPLPSPGLFDSPGGQEGSSEAACISDIKGQKHYSREKLDYYWTFAVYHEGQTQIVNGVNLICRWKPVLLFQNGKANQNGIFCHCWGEFFFSVLIVFVSHRHCNVALP